MTALEFNFNVISLRDKLKFFALKLTQNGDDADDLLQDTMLKAMVNRDKFQEKTNLAAWLYTIMKNTFINNYRKAAKANTIIDNTKELYYLNIPQSTGSISPESRYSEKEIKNHVDALDETYRVPFQMHYDGYKYKEIADTLDIPIGTVKSRIFLARKELMETLKDYKKRDA